jgi:hypothetical protein
MEVEFLSNIRYDLFSSEAEWSRWNTKLGLFADYFNQASMLPVETPTMLRVSPPRVQSQSPSSKLPSPVTDFRPQPQPNWYMPLNGLPPYSLPPQPLSGDISSGSRKRSRDDNEELHPTKRTAMTSATFAPSMTIPVTSMNAMPTLPPVLTPTSAPVAPMASNISRLPPPHHSAHLPNAYSTPQTLPPAAPSHLPAIMPPIYNRPQNWQQMPPLSVPPMQSGIYNAPSLSDLGRHHQGSFGVSSATVSPAVSAYSVHTPQAHLSSPSFFLANRNSPYRPVCSVNTLLIPPPSSSLQQQRSVPFDHMHYQPLGKGSTRKTGLLPYIQPDAWNQAPYLHSIYPPTSYAG